MNIDTPEFNIVVDKETTGEKKDVATKPPIDNIVVETPTKNVEIGVETQLEQTEQSIDPLVTGKDIDNTINTHIEKPTKLEQPTNNIEKLVEILTVDNTEVHTEKLIVNTTETSSEKLVVESTMKSNEVQVEKHEEKKVES